MKPRSSQNIIYTGPIRSGKSTSLHDLVNDRNDVGGFLTLDVDGLRQLYDIRQKVYHPFQTELSENTITIGRFTFLKSAFESMGEIVTRDVKADCRYLVIDELGKLELKKEGLYKMAMELISKQDELAATIIWIVREGLVTEISELFGMDNSTVLKKEDLSNVF